MKWTFNLDTMVAEHSESQSAFRVEVHGNDFDLTPLSGKALSWTEAALKEAEKEFQADFDVKRTKEVFRSRLRDLIRKKLDGDNFKAADVISRKSGREVSPRSVQAWQSPLNLRSSRPCPRWALEALETYVPPSTETQVDVSADRDTPVLQNEVSLADQKVEAEENRLKKWEKTSLAELPKSIASMDTFFTGYVCKLDDELRVFTSALETSQSFEEYKTRVKEELERLRANRFAVHTAAQAIRDGQEEFSNPEGLPRKKRGEGKGQDS